MFNEVPAEFDFPAAERDVLAFWDANRIYEKSLERRRGGKPFVFYEGPPTANGLPHPGHCLTRAIKDLFPRYRTMCGYYCERKAGWDTHGLPVEVEVCKELGIHGKDEIEAFGIEKFNRKCLESVFRYTKEWETLTRRLGFWVNLDEAYVTYHQSYVESVWWSLKTLFDRGLLYQGHKVVWWWAQGGTALSAGEVGQGYREVDDPSVFVRFPIVMDERAKKVGIPEKTSLLVWTTTPWTLISNTFAAVNKDFEYGIVHDEKTGERLILAAELVGPIGKKAKREWVLEKRIKGSELVGLRYAPPFDNYYTKLGDRKLALRSGGDEHVAWRVLHANFVTLESGTGLVHEAPAFGEVDFDLMQDERKRFNDEQAVPLLCAVGPDGKFTDEAPAKYRGRWVKEADKDIIHELKDRGLLLHQEQYRHEYPFCWRADQDPLIQYPRKSWFVRTTQFVDAMLANNSAINWLPDHIKAGRFGKFLESNVDWALSRERFWGTPLPIWVCEKTGKMDAIGSFDELRKKPGATDGGLWARKKSEDATLSDHLQVHKPYIDAWTYDSPYAQGAKMRRVPEVIDCWYDAGCMPFAQWGFPHEAGSVDKFEKLLPADFISEAIDQTRGWFYALLAISTLLWGPEMDVDPSPKSRAWKGDRSSSVISANWPHPFRNCIVLGLILGEDGQKLSKSKRNYKEPSYIFDKEGADAMRWYFFSAQAPWTSTRFQERAIAESQRDFLIRLYNVYSFFVIYANIDKWAPPHGKSALANAALTELDRWILAELHRTTREVRRHMDAYDNFAAARELIDFVDVLSNWYVRRSRDRFWAAGMGPDKQAAYATLYDCLLTTAKLIAPFVPYYAETIYQNLVRTADTSAPESIHLCDYPAADAALIDDALIREAATVREIVSLGRAARADAKLRVRQPLAQVEIVVADRSLLGWLEGHKSLIADELNVKNVAFITEADKYVEYRIAPNFKAIGPKFGALAPKIKEFLSKAADPAALRRDLDASGKIAVTIDGKPVELTGDDVQIGLTAKPGWAAAQGRNAVVVLSVEVDDELRSEGLAREVVHHVQQLRKKLQLRYEQRIELGVSGDEAIAAVVEKFGDYIAGETLATKLSTALPPGASPESAEIEGHATSIALRPL